MKAKITNTCICCGSCASICPVGAIGLTPTGEKYEVDKTKCVGCGACIRICPVEAIVPEEESK